MDTVAKKLNASIAEFASRPENSALRPATGGYSTPFRGKLFGHERARDVEAELRHRKSALLFLGSNPNCPGSLDLLKAKTDGEGHWLEFQQQMQSGYFGERVVDDTGTVRAWDPLHEPSSMGRGQRFSWQFYAQSFQNGGAPLDAVAMANIFSWGSGNLNDLVSHLSSHDPQLLDRVVDFANEQLRVMITALRPQLVVCPRSASNHPKLRRLLVSTTNAQNVADVSATGLEGRAFHMHRGNVYLNGYEQPVLFLSHPSALRGHRALDRPKIGEAIASAVQWGLDVQAGTAT